MSFFYGPTEMRDAVDRVIAHCHVGTGKALRLICEACASGEVRWYPIPIFNKPSDYSYGPTQPFQWQDAMIELNTGIMRCGTDWFELPKIDWEDFVAWASEKTSEQATPPATGEVNEPTSAPPWIMLDEACQRVAAAKAPPSLGGALRAGVANARAKALAEGRLVPSRREADPFAGVRRDLAEILQRGRVPVAGVDMYARRRQLRALADSIESTLKDMLEIAVLPGNLIGVRAREDDGGMFTLRYRGVQVDWPALATEMAVAGFRPQSETDWRP
jgi:hypothetical protein